MKTLLLSASILFGANFINVSGQYTNNSFNGPWMTILEDPNDTMYFYHHYDGNGVINYLGVFDGLQAPMGTYSVQSSGAYTGSIPVWGATTSGQLSSATQGTFNIDMGSEVINGLPIFQVQQPSALAGTWQGYYLWDSTGTSTNSSLEIGYGGIVTDADAFTGTFSGFVFSQNGKVAGYYENGESDMWGKIQMMGIQDADTIKGQFSIDCDCPGGYFEFVRSVDISNVENHQLGKMKIYPNPAQNELFIESISEGNFTVEIINLIGKVVSTSKMNMNNNIQSINIDDLATGNYIISIYNNTEKRQSMFVKK